MISLNTFLTLALMITAIASRPAFAANIDVLEGTYRAQLAETSVLSAYEVEAVWTLGQAGIDRLEYLKRELNATCQHTSRGLYRCQRFIERLIPARIQERIARDFTGANLVMRPAESVELLYQGDDIEEYLVTQEGIMSTPLERQNFSTWRYFFGRNDLQKIQAGEKNPTPYSFVRVGDTLQLVRSESTTLDRFRFQIWVVTVPFKREI
jgi:hypothetical protein